MLTAHGLYSLSETVALTGFEKKFEFDALSFLVRASVVVSVVSSGMKKVVEQYISGGRDIESLKVVLNPIKVGACSALNKARKKRIICAGSLSALKNQGQLIRALASIAPETKEGLEVMFAGKDTMGGELQRLAAGAGVDDMCRFPGQLPRERILELMGESHCVAMMSLSEGFGLPVAEGYSMGLPAMFFGDVYAAADFDDPGCALIMEDHSDECGESHQRDIRQRMGQEPHPALFRQVRRSGHRRRIRPDIFRPSAIRHYFGRDLFLSRGLFLPEKQGIIPVKQIYADSLVPRFFARFQIICNDNNIS
ncbi:MAG: glycosyltransferase [Rikenellaceae bacterium]|jgi:hypothetical protein|nr:glycosyltransferase [Rikenellaceae bacterium]